MTRQDIMPPVTKPVHCDALITTAEDQGDTIKAGIETRTWTGEIASGQNMELDWKIKRFSSDTRTDYALSYQINTTTDTPLQMLVMSRYSVNVPASLDTLDMHDY
ncbi:hypothetical protein RRG08_052702 [Elysia crispata]|uniref:Uncharacterized protein n=1 Tax=Elysia crispata TaxID=231223 RepID=A0AAE1EA57_9GAST|nr:hypothetical protein RRG08_052702 [Elysia crispata]